MVCTALLETSSTVYDFLSHGRAKPPGSYQAHGTKSGTLPKPHENCAVSIDPQQPKSAVPALKLTYSQNLPIICRLTGFELNQLRNGCAIK